MSLERTILFRSMTTKADIKNFNAKKYVKDGTKEEDVVLIKKCFDLFDRDKSGTLDLNELKNAIEAVGMEKSAEQIMNLLNDLDPNKDNVLDFDEFIEILGSQGRDMNDEEHVTELFSEFAKDTNKFSFDDFIRIAHEIEVRFGNEELRKMFDVADTDNDGYISIEEFRNVLQVV